MNTQRIEKATTKTNLRAMANLALQAASDLDDEQKAEVTRRVGVAYLRMEDGDTEPDASNLRDYLSILIAGQRVQDYYDQHGHPEGL
jgi:hypothetical protein